MRLKALGARGFACRPGKRIGEHPCRHQRPFNERYAMTNSNRPPTSGMYSAYLEALARKREREGRTVPDVVDDPDYWHRRAHWNAKQNEWVEQNGINKAEFERKD